MDNNVTLAGNVVSEPIMRTTRDGVAVLNFRMAQTPRRFDRATGEWRDCDPVFITVNCWRGLAHNVQASVRKGEAVFVNGRLLFRRFQGKDGQDHQAHEIEAAIVGHDLSRGCSRWARSQRLVPPQGEPVEAAATSPPSSEEPITGEGAAA